MIQCAVTTWAVLIACLVCVVWQGSEDIVQQVRQQCGIACHSSSTASTGQRGQSPNLLQKLHQVALHGHFVCVCPCVDATSGLCACCLHTRGSTVEQMHSFESLRPRNREALTNSEVVAALKQQPAIFPVLGYNVQSVPLSSFLPNVLSMVQPSSSPVYVGKYSKNGELFLSTNQGPCTWQGLSLVGSR